VREKPCFRIVFFKRVNVYRYNAVHRIAELLKVFNSRACQLVLGAGAMQVSGLRSITAKHLVGAVHVESNPVNP
jgi:hypothetical protein